MNRTFKTTVVRWSSILSIKSEQVLSAWLQTTSIPPVFCDSAKMYAKCADFLKYNYIIYNWVYCKYSIKISQKHFVSVTVKLPPAGDSIPYFFYPAAVFMMSPWSIWRVAKSDATVTHEHKCSKISCKYFKTCFTNKRFWVQPKIL